MYLYNFIYHMEKCFWIIPLIQEWDDMKVILVKHHQWHRWFPKWHAKKGETELQTAKRELYEEAWIKNIEIDNDQIFSEEYSFIDQTRKYLTKLEKKVLYFVWYVKAPYTIKIDESEIVDFKICLLKEAISILTFDSSKNIIIQIIDKLK